MKNDLEQFKALMGDPIKQLEEIVASLKLERTKLEAKQQPKPQIPTTIEAVYGDTDYADNSVQVGAFEKLLHLVDCLDSHFGEGVGDEYVYAIDRDYDVDCFEVDEYNKPLITFKTEQAADHALEYFKPLFERYYGVTL